MGNVGVKPDTLADGAINERTDTVITAADEIIFGDVTDSNNLKKDTVQGILDLAPAGIILQVVIDREVTGIALSSTTYTDIGLSVTITPASTNNKILIYYTHDASVNGGFPVEGGSKLLRDATALLTLPYELYNQDTFNGYKALRGSHYYLDSPASISALTYKLQMNGSANLHALGVNTEMVAMEVKG